MHEPFCGELPVIALRGLVLFPQTTIHFEVGRKKSVAAVKAAMETDQTAFFVAQTDVAVDNPDFSDLSQIGVVGKIKQILKTSDKDILRVVIDGSFRACITEATGRLPYLKATVAACEEERIKQSSIDYEGALIRKSLDLFFRYADMLGGIAPDIIFSVEKCKDAGNLADQISGAMFLEYTEKISILSELNPISRLETVCVTLMNEIHFLEIEGEITDKLQKRIDKDQRNYQLHEQMKVIAEELGETESPIAEYERYIEKINTAAFSEDIKQKLTEEAGRLKSMAPSSPDANVIRTYLDRCLSLPWNKYTKDNLDLAHAERVLNREHYGLDEIKERILELIAAMRVSPDIKGQIICLAGPPGVGKTSIIKSIAKALGRKYQRIALGGVHDEAEIRGHRRTYIGAIPGRIMNSVSDAGSANPLILLDEIDKLSGDFRGDPASALLEALDAEQNNTFTDHYIDLPFDLSKVLFITTANDKYSIPEALLDRMEVIDLYSYTAEEKFNIAKKHLVKKQFKEHGITTKNLKITDNALRLIIEGYTKEAGVRKLERQIAKICRKVCVKIANDPDSKTTVNDKNLEEFLGSRIYKNPEDSFESSIGLVNGLAWTSVGGELLQIEATVLDGTGKTELTGSLGDVMKESAMAAISYVRSRADKLGIDGDFYKTKDIHIHIPEGAVPKDGPSAGITMTTCLVSALTGKKVSGEIAMTGEVTLRGRVLPIGGLKEKSMAAYKAGLKTVIIPDDNVSDLEKIDKKVKESVNFIPVKTVDEVLSKAIIGLDG